MPLISCAETVQPPHVIPTWPTRGLLDYKMAAVAAKHLRQICSIRHVLRTRSLSTLPYGYIEESTTHEERKSAVSTSSHSQGQHFESLPVFMFGRVCACSKRMQEVCGTYQRIRISPQKLNMVAKQVSAFLPAPHDIAPLRECAGAIVPFYIIDASLSPVGPTLNLFLRFVALPLTRH